MNWIRQLAGHHVAYQNLTRSLIIAATAALVLASGLIGVTVASLVLAAMLPLRPVRRAKPVPGEMLPLAR